MDMDSYGGNDGVEETFETVMRAGIAAAARVAEAMARLRQQMQERAAAQSADAADDLRRRLQAEMTLARASYRGVEDPAWWSRAMAADVQNAYRAAATWREVDPQAARAIDTMNTEISDRYGVGASTSTSTNVEPDTELARTARDLEHQVEVDLAEATVLLAAADRSDQTARGGDGALRAGEPAWDSAARREATAHDLAAIVPDEAAVEARMATDLAQALSATEATRAPRGPAKTRKHRNTDAMSKERDLSR